MRFALNFDVSLISTEVVGGFVIKGINEGLKLERRRHWHNCWQCHERFSNHVLLSSEPLSSWLTGQNWRCRSRLVPLCAKRHGFEISLGLWHVNRFLQRFEIYDKFSVDVTQLKTKTALLDTAGILLSRELKGCPGRKSIYHWYTYVCWTVYAPLCVSSVWPQKGQKNEMLFSFFSFLPKHEPHTLHWNWPWPPLLS